MRNYIPKELNFYFSSIGLGVNFFFTSFILVLSAIFGFYEFAAELGLLKAGIFMVCQMLSSNARTIIISKNKEYSYDHFFNLRLIVGFLIFSIFTIVIFLINSEYKFLIFILSCMIVIQWISEIIITSLHSQKKNAQKIAFIFFQILFVLLTTLCFFYKSLFFLEIISILYIFFYLIFFLQYYKKFFLNFKKFEFQKSFKKAISLSLFSSISINFTNLIWRVIIINFASKDFAGALFAGFAFASFLGSFFHNIIGPILFEKKNTKTIIKFLIDYILLLIILGTWFVVYYFQDKLVGVAEIKLFFYNTILISLMGSYFMMKSHYLRFDYFFKEKKNQNSVFSLDIIYSFFCVFTVPLLFHFGGIEGLKYSYLMSSVISFLIFFTVSQYNIKE